MAVMLNLSFVLLLYYGVGHYFVESRARCVRFDEKNMTNDCSDVTSCKRTETCTGPKDSMFPSKPFNTTFDNIPSNYCYAIFKSVGNSFKGEINLVQVEQHNLSAVLSGCNYHVIPCAKNVSNECVLERHSHMEEYYECCCFGDFCNKNVNMDSLRNNVQNDLVVLDTVKNGKRWTLIIPVTAFTLIILLGISLLFIKRHLKKRKNLHAQMSPKPEPPLESVEMHEILYKGHFNTVWKALYRKKWVAVKIFTSNSKSLWEVEKNIYKNCNVSHENILKFVGAESRKENGVLQYLILTDLAECGSLTDYLSSVVHLTYDTMLQLMTSLVRGLTYLHAEDFFSVNRKPVIAHRDLKSRNVLVKRNLTCCIGDFGSSLVFWDHMYERSHGADLQVGTTRYMAPEVLQGAVAFHLSAVLCTDNYSLGLVLWEILSRNNLYEVDKYCLPYAQEVEENPSVFNMRRVVVEKQIRPNIKDKWRNDERLSEICNTIERCWDVDSDARLSAHCVLVRLSSLVRCNCEQDENIIVCTPQEHQQPLSTEHHERDCLIMNVSETANKDPEKG